MRNYNKIEDALLKADAGILQRIAQLLINGEYNTPPSLVALGSAIGSNKTKTGVPDIYFSLPNGKIVYVEITSQKDGLYGDSGKITQDLLDCEKEANRLNAKVEKVIYISNHAKPDTVQLVRYIEICDRFCKGDVKFELWGIDKLTTLLTVNYKGIAREVFEIQDSFGSLRTLSEWNASKNDVSQVHEFVAREEEIKEISEQMDNGKVPILRGQAGCGKTRLAIEVAKRLTQDENKVFIIKSIFEKTLDDLRNEDDGKVRVFIIDDANKTPYLKNFIAYAKENKNNYVIATVRDYVWQDLRLDLHQSGVDAQVFDKKIEPMSSEQQEIVIKKVCPQVDFPPQTLRMIKDIAKGNLRFAVMCAQVFVGSNKVPETIKELVKIHFDSIMDDNKNKDKNTISLTRDDKKKYDLALFAVSLMHRIIDHAPYGKENQLDHTLSNIGIDRSDFIDAMNYWSAKEAVNISYNGKVFEVADQILAHYWFYKSIFDDKIISLEKVFEIFFPTERGRIVQMFQAVVPIYGYDGTPIKVGIDALWESKYKINADKLGTLNFIQAFHALIPQQTLDYMKSGTVVGSEDDQISLLCSFENSDWGTQAADILFDVLSKSKEEWDKKKIDNLTERLSVGPYSFDNKLATQIYVLKKLKGELHNEFLRRIFISYSKALLRFSFNPTTFETEQAMTCWRINIVPCDEVFELRKYIWEGLFSIFAQGIEQREVFKILDSNQNNRIIGDGKHNEIVDKDAEVIKSLLQAFSPSSFEDRIFAKKAIDCVYNEKDAFFSDYEKALKKADKSFSIYMDAHPRREKKADRFRYVPDSERYAPIVKKIKNKTLFIDYLEKFYTTPALFQADDETVPIIPDRAVPTRQSRGDIEALFIEAQEANPSDVFPLLKEVMQRIPFVFCHSYRTMEIIYKNLNLKELFNLFCSAYKNGYKDWLLSFLMQVEEKDIDDEIFDTCVQVIDDVYINPKVTSWWGNLSSFYRFEKHKTGFFASVFSKMIDNHSKGEKIKVQFVQDFFCHEERAFWGHYGFTTDELEAAFGDRVEELLYEMYFLTIGTSASLDYKGSFIKKIGKKDIKYVLKYFELFVETHSDYMSADVIKEFPNVAENLITILNKYSAKKELWKLGIRFDKLLLQIFYIDEYKRFIDLIIKNHLADTALLNTVASLSKKTNDEFIFYYADKLIAADIGEDLFKKIDLFGYPSSWSGGTPAMIDRCLSRIEKYLNRSVKIDAKYACILTKQVTDFKKWRVTAELDELTRWGNLS